MQFSLVEKMPLANDQIVLYFPWEIETQVSDLYKLS